MPSPSPGMDPYLEAPDIWPDFHDAFAGEIRAALGPSSCFERVAACTPRHELTKRKEEDPGQGGQAGHSEPTADAE
jgi:Protein of unknown function (DUF4058)